ncbi:alpha/beta fold hydrolase [Leifsonia bigeumensis]|uniref:Alpha/beta fold hydrolase n=1 Tax=Leifsonella bigeumensis TaxID=433643 RepID=A0ABP7F911_9MICO
MPYVYSRGVRLCYDRIGEGQPLVLLHGASQDSTSWRFNWDEFGRYYDVIALDNPGHGKSAVPPSGPVESVDEFADYAWGMIEALGLERPIIMGHSLSAAVALRLAVRYGSQLTGVVAVDGAARTKNATHYRPGLLDYVAINPMAWIETTFLSVLGRATPIARKREMARDARRAIPEVSVADLVAYTSCDFLDELSSIVCPVVTVVGEDDWSCTPELAAESHEKITSRKAFHCFEGVGHIPHTEQPEVFNETLLRLMASTFGTGSQANGGQS